MASKDSLGTPKNLVTEFFINWNVEPAPESDSLDLWKKYSYNYAIFSGTFKRPWDKKYDDITKSVVEEDNINVIEKREQEKKRIENYTKRKDAEPLVPVPPHLLFPAPPKPFSQKSNLAFDEMKVYLNLYEKFQQPLPSFITPMEQKELDVYKALREKIVTESDLFNKFAKEVSKGNLIYLQLKQEAKEYISSLIEVWWKKAYDYPRYYSLESHIPLTYAMGATKLRFVHIDTVFKQGTIPKLSQLDPNLPAYAPVGPKVSTRYPAAKIHNTQNLCDDDNIKNLIINHHIDVVTNSSVLATLLDDTAESWMIPIVIREYSKQGIVKKVVYIEEKLCPLTFNNMERNSIYYYYSVKTLMTHPVFKSRSDRSKPEEAEGEKDETSSSIAETGCPEYNDDIFGSDCDITQLEDDVSSSLKSTLTSSSGKETRSKEAIDSDKEEVAPETNDTDVESATSADEEKLSVTSSSSDSEDNLVIDLKEENVTGVSTRSRSKCLSPIKTVPKAKTGGKKSIKASKNVKSKDKTDGCKRERKTKPGLSSAKQSVQKSELSDEKGAKVSPVAVAKTGAVNEADHGDAKASSFKKPVVAKSPPASLNDNNYAYENWTLGNKNSTLSILIRDSLDAYGVDKNGKRYVTKLSCKLEYQHYFGCEKMSKSALLQEYMTTAVHPDAKLLRVRVSAHNNAVIMTEDLKPADIVSQSDGGINVDLCLNNLFGIMSRLKDFDSGIYVFTYNSDISKDSAQLHGDSVKKSGNFNLHSQFNFNVPNGEKRISEIPWTPIDYKVVSPYHIANQRAPGCFPPGLFKHSKLLENVMPKKPAWKNKGAQNKRKNAKSKAKRKQFNKKGKGAKG